jgi:acetyl-CoA carboxylase biotin carboxyl carrier protein
MKGERLDLKELKEILQILEDKEITEFELEEEGLKLRIRKSVSLPASQALAPAMTAPAPVHAPAPVAQAPVAVLPVSSTTPAAAVAGQSQDDLFIVKSPIVGTFYRSPDPNSPMFVNVGDHVRVGQVLCIIEAMKLMNEIEAEIAGEVVRIHHENGQPVQYGEPIFSIRQEH